MRLALIASIIMLTACTREVVIPDDVLPQKKLSLVLIDVHLLESKINAMGLEGDTSFQVYRHFEAQLFEKHEVDSLSYRRSMDFYLQYPDLLEGVYNQVIDSLLIRQKDNRIEW